MAQSYVSTKNGCFAIAGMTAIPGSFRIQFVTAQNQVIEMCSGGYVNRVEGIKDILFSARIYLQKGVTSTAPNVDGLRGQVTATVDTGSTIVFNGVIESAVLVKDEGSIVTLDITGAHYGSSGSDIVVTHPTT
jgi:hypothetical protein